MNYTNVKMPVETAWLDTDNDIFAMLDALVGEGCQPLGEPLHYCASIGGSNYGPYVEGDIDFTYNGEGYRLSYDFMVISKDVARVFRAAVFDSNFEMVQL